MKFSENLYNLRQKEGLSQKDLASALGVSQASINYWEKGQRIPSMDMIAKISNYFHVSADYLIDISGTSLNPPTIVKLTGKVLELNDLYFMLNDDGQKKAIEQVELLTKIPEFQKHYTNEQ